MGPLENKGISTVYPKKYAHGFCFAVLCCGYTLTDFPISIRLTSLALWQSNDCPSASKATLMNMNKYFMWIHYERLHNHNKAKHNKTVCIFLGIYCTWHSDYNGCWWAVDVKPDKPHASVVTTNRIINVYDLLPMYVVLHCFYSVRSTTTAAAAAATTTTITTTSITTTTTTTITIITITTITTTATTVTKVWTI